MTRYTLNEIINAVSRITKVDVGRIKSRDKNEKTAKARNAYYYICKELGYPADEYTEFVNRERYIDSYVYKLRVDINIINEIKRFLKIARNKDDYVVTKDDIYTIQDVSCSGHPLFLLFKNGDYVRCSEDKLTLRKSIAPIK